MNKRALYVLGILLLAPGTSYSGLVGSIDGILGLRPVGDRSCLAQEIVIPEGQALAGLRWFHNDGTLAFPQLLLLGGTPSQLPGGLQLAGVELTNVRGPSLGWGEVSFREPVTSASGLAVAVFVLPAHAERTGDGASGGPGIGFRRQLGGPRAFVSADGVFWEQMNNGFRLAVEPVLEPLGGTATLLSSRGSSPDGVGVAPVEAFAASAPSETRLLPATPNPSNPSTAIGFELRRPGEIRIQIFDLAGRHVRTLADGVWPAGRHSVTWSGTDDRESPVASSVYLVRLEADGRNWTQRLALVR
jgi:hypothetical protein